MGQNFNTSHVNVNRLFLLLDNSPVPDFNTSHVNVNPHRSEAVRWSHLISIHLMLMLICIACGNKIRLECISIHLMLMLIMPCNPQSVQSLNFNTSHVNVNLQSLFFLLLPFGNFNTSHVNVNRLSSKRLDGIIIHFNTSHVNVNLYWFFYIVKHC